MTEPQVEDPVKHTDITGYRYWEKNDIWFVRDLSTGNVVGVQTRGDARRIATSGVVIRSIDEEKQLRINWQNIMQKEEIHVPYLTWRKNTTGY